MIKPGHKEAKQGNVEPNISTVCYDRFGQDIQQ